jgi:hypothetical protein
LSDKHEQEYFDALRRIAREYRPPEWFEKNAEKTYGVSPDEALQMAYDNMQQTAASAIRGRKRPEVKER